MTSFKLDPKIRAKLTQKSNVMGSLALAKDWSLIVFAFGLSFLWPNPLSFVVSMILLAGAQVGLSILMHDASHRALFSKEKTNDFVGEYLCALPTFNSLAGYRAYHMTHHRLAGTKDDPDLHMTQQYPVSKASLRRKIVRDLSGLTGIKSLIGLLGMKCGYWKYTLNGLTERVIYTQPQNLANYIQHFIKNNGLVSVAWQIIIWAVLYSLGNGWLFLLWVGAYLIPFPLFLRVRQIADHAVVEDMLSTNPLLHARSSKANWLEKLLIAPHHEHYHLEHHFLATAPSWNLPKLHAILVKEGVIPPTNQASGIIDVLKRATQMP
ncbi:MAG: fatty acid desaturase family protein [Moraxellaceae bacterium]|jgi:fatty acid desaturase|nr:fatty acid desaturase family protein [Moraxellaceae bacterium]MBK8325790.1 fatty acid desaturase family protein [Moraxellaceae bacterium]